MGHVELLVEAVCVCVGGGGGGKSDPAGSYGMCGVALLGSYGLGGGRVLSPDPQTLHRSGAFIGCTTDQPIRALDSVM